MKNISFRNNIKKLITKRFKWSRRYHNTMSLQLHDRYRSYTLEGASKYIIRINSSNEVYLFLRNISTKALEHIRSIVSDDCAQLIDEGKFKEGTLLIYKPDFGIIHHEQLPDDISKLPLSPTLLKHIRYCIYKYLRHQDMQRMIFKYTPISNRLRKLGGKDDRFN